LSPVGLQAVLSSFSDSSDLPSELPPAVLQSGSSLSFLLPPRLSPRAFS